jgi:deoxycytidylate deaminase
MKNTFLQSHVVLKDSFETQTVSRFLDLLFSTHKETPEKDEYFMNLAFTSALKAGDLSRQVGAVIVSSCSDQISCGANEVNKFKGGSYWGSDSGHRDLDEKKDPNKEVISTIKDTLRQRIGKLGLTGDQIETLIGDTRIDDLTEFHRATHAEMDAILSAHRNGTPVRGSTLYCTTFPCHNCAKHIVSAGVERVVYLEPYAKSLATDLHFDSISKSKEENKVHFDCFHGVTHLRFKDLFSTNYSSGSVIERKSAENVVPEYIRSEASLRFTIWNKLLENLGKIVLDTFTPDGVIKIEKVVNGD